ncbi:Alpha carbonic anhydrase [Trinorchestia longiramus]|nr:Alpha carbonic anhydrase [Trinorchestia longiramus]
MDLYRNFSEASDRANGVAAVAIFLKEGRQSNPFIGMVLDHLPNVHQRGNTGWVRGVALKTLFTSPHYLTYEGSLTEPPCEETVTWVLLNRPAYISSQQVGGVPTERLSSTVCVQAQSHSWRCDRKKKNNGRCCNCDAAAGKDVATMMELLLHLQNLRRGGQGQSTPTVGNVRPTQPLNSRPVRTNIPPHLLVSNLFSPPHLPTCW